MLTGPVARPVGIDRVNERTVGVSSRTEATVAIRHTIGLGGRGAGASVTGSVPALALFEPLVAPVVIAE